MYTHTRAHTLVFIPEMGSGYVTLVDFEPLGSSDNIASALQVSGTAGHAPTPGFHFNHLYAHFVGH